MKYLFGIIIFSCSMAACGQQLQQGSQDYTSRVLEATEVDFLSSYYAQDGQNAAVSGGRGTEDLTDITATIVLSIPLNENDILTIDAGVSAYTSASSSNVNPFDNSAAADPFVATSGASGADTWASLKGAYSHSTKDRNAVWTANLSVAAEYDYFSAGFGGSYSRLFNERNTEISVVANVFLDNWNAIYPFELRPFIPGGGGLGAPFFTFNTISGDPNYAPGFTEFNTTTRNSYSLGLNLSQVLSKKAQGSILVDFVRQSGLLSTPFQRVYFSDVADSFIESFQLADDIERLPESRFKIAVGGRLNYYLNETFVLRTFYRYYTDDWGVNSHTASLEIPVKLTEKLTIYPSYRYYKQTAADYFAIYEGHLSTDEFYTSDYDLSEYTANQFGFGATYTDIFTKLHIWKFGLKSIDAKFINYDRSNTLSSWMITTGFKFVFD